MNASTVHARGGGACYASVGSAAATRFATARSTLATVALLLTAASTASAHPGHGGGVAAGALHPVSGLDHVLAMVAVGLLAARVGGRALWLLPVTFVSLMIAGGLVANAGARVPAVEQWIAASVLVLGLMLCVAGRLPLVGAAGMVGLFAIFHGYAHVAEMTGSSAMGYTFGFAGSTAILHCAGIACGLLIARAACTSPAARGLARAFGVAITACGALLLAGVL